ncbi:MAG: basic secretory protein-like protein [Fermentimonas sp.]|jgi:hypothetical protein
MKKVYLLFTLMLLISCNSTHITTKNGKETNWNSFNLPNIIFVNHAQGTEGWEIYNRIVPNPEKLISESIIGVVKTLYWTPYDSIPNVKNIHYTFEDKKGISAKGGSVPNIHIFYSSRWVEQSAKNGGDDRVLYETEGVLYHELVHGFQLEPQGIGSYGTNKVFFAFIEGMADAVRAHNGYFPPENRRPGGHWLDGYQTTGFFLQWLTTKDPDFLRKFNHSALEVVPWSFDGAIKHIFGNEYCIEGLWEEYQNAIS